MTPLRIGVLGAARITPFALIAPARQTPGVAITTVAARDEARARAFAKKHGIPSVAPSYEAMLADPSIDAIYNPLPNSHHEAWTVRALDAGKHVLCEKPLTANAAEAESVAAAQARSGKVCLEAFHWRYHPMAARMIEIVRSGELGAIRRVETSMCIPLPMPNDIRYDLALAGGATMDTGCYAISMLRHLAGAEPEVVSAKALLARPGVDRRMDAELRFADGSTGAIHCSLWSWTLLKIEARVVGEKGTMVAFNPVGPQVLHRLTVTTAAGERRERFEKTATYVHQLRAFRAAVQDGAPYPTHVGDALANMRVIDAVYRAAGLPLREGLTSA